MFLLPTGKIYTVRSYKSDEVYVGSTIQELSMRMGGHRADFKQGKVLGKNKLIVENIEDWYIELYEIFPCNLKTELKRREGEVIRQIGTLNKQIAGRTRQEYYIDNAEKYKEYDKQNADKKKEYNKEYRIKNADKKKEYDKEYRIKNADKIKENNKEYYTDHKEEAKQYYTDHKEEIKQNQKEYNTDHKEELKEQHKQYRTDHKEYQKQYIKQYNIKKKLAKSQISN